MCDNELLINYNMKDIWNDLHELDENKTYSMLFH